MAAPRARRWVGNLARFLQHLVGHFASRVTDENSPRNGDAEDDVDSDSDDGSEAPDSPRGQPGAEEADALMGEAAHRAHLGPDARRTIAAIIIRLASRAQYSKVSRGLHCLQALLLLVGLHLAQFLPGCCMKHSATATSTEYFSVSCGVI